MVETLKRPRKIFIKKAIKVGNSAGVLLPKSYLGSDVRIIILNSPQNLKRDILKILEPILEDILGIYLIQKTEKSAEILVVSLKTNKHIEKLTYKINIVPLNILKKSIKEKQITRERIKNSKTIINKKLLHELIK